LAAVEQARDMEDLRIAASSPFDLSRRLEED
jgi:hypothetical protein